MVFSSLCGAGCRVGRAPANDGFVEIAEAEYGQRQIDVLQPTPFRCADDAVSTLCGDSPIQTVVVADSNMYMVSDGEVRLSISDGEPRLLARRGSGPGELRAPIAFGSDRNDRLLVFDIARMRLLSIGAIEPTAEVAAFPPLNFQFPLIRSGEFYALTLPPGAEFGELVDAAILRFSATTETWADTVARFSEPARSVRGSGERRLMAVPWDRSLLWDACDDGRVVLAHSDEWLVEWYGDSSASNVASMGVSRPKARTQSMTSDEYDSLIAQQLARVPVSIRSGLAEQLAARPRPLNRRVLDAVYCGADGTAVLVNSPDFGDSVRTIDMIRDDGTLLRSVRIPSTFRILDLQGDRFFGFILGEDLSERLAQVKLGLRRSRE